MGNEICCGRKSIEIISSRCLAIGGQEKGSSDFNLGVLVPRNAVLEKFEANFRW